MAAYYHSLVSATAYSSVMSSERPAVTSYRDYGNPGATVNAFNEDDVYTDPTQDVIILSGENETHSI